MSRGETYERVRTALSALRGRYGPCPVRQTTLPVPSPTYDQLCGLAEQSVVDAGVRIRNSRGDTLTVPGGGGWTDPTGAVATGESIEAGACRILEERAGCRCRIEGLLGITILCLTDASDATRDPVYRLGALFDGGRTDDVDGEEWQWRTSTDAPFASSI
ncbi:NUDIX hydrolase [Halomarina rubra]|uniref:NUDIX hydrolase n=1 Tax=Halomarina rubra TaxID=2071873 RepID=A0ABD6AQ64_9EURY|nr:hypothetical protein [Halomarina rubra]